MRAKDAALMEIVATDGYSVTLVWQFRHVKRRSSSPNLDLDRVPGPDPDPDPGPHLKQLNAMGMLVFGMKYHGMLFRYSTTQGMEGHLLGFIGTLLSVPVEDNTVLPTTICLHRSIRAWGHTTHQMTW